MNYSLPPDEGKKKKNLYWNVCIVLGIIAIIAFIVDANQGMNEVRGEYVTNSAGDNMYECADGESSPSWTARSMGRALGVWKWRLVRPIGSTLVDQEQIVRSAGRAVTMERPRPQSTERTAQYLSEKLRRFPKVLI